MAEEAPSRASSVSAPLLVVASDNKGGFVAVITALAMCFVLVAFGIRLYVRMAISGFRLDDLVLAITSVCFFFLFPFGSATNRFSGRFSFFTDLCVFVGVFLCSVHRCVYTSWQRIW